MALSIRFKGVFLEQSREPHVTLSKVKDLTNFQVTLVLDNKKIN